jgi:hypothetical protein
VGVEVSVSVIDLVAVAKLIAMARTEMTEGQNGPLTFLETRQASSEVPSVSVQTSIKVPVFYPAVRCVRCGDKIKDDMMWRSEILTGAVFVHEDCANDAGEPLPRDE